MLALDVIRNGRSVSLELPVPIDILCGELRSIGVYEPLTEIQRTDVLLQPTNALGEHFMKLVQPDDCLQAIATACRETEVLAGESREALETMLMTDSFSDLDQMNSYLRYGPAALDRFIRLNLDGRTLDLPCSYLREKLGRSPQEMRLIDTGYEPLNDQGKALLCELSPYDTIATADMACVMMQVPGVVATTREVVDSARRLLPQPEMQELNFFCPLTLRMEEDDGYDLVETDPHILPWFEGEISAALRNEIHEGENMADYLDEPLKGKVASVEFDVARFGDLLYGKISCELRTPLTEAEQTEFVDWATGQASDGLGEGFEQRPVSTSEGNLYVSLWHGGADYFMLPEQDFLVQLEAQTLDTQGFSGMGGMS